MAEARRARPHEKRPDKCAVCAESLERHHLVSIFDPTWVICMQCGLNEAFSDPSKVGPR